MRDRHYDPRAGLRARRTRGVRDAAGIIALLDDANPNVFFEVGYAMALEKPIIFVAHEDQDVPFDLQMQRRVSYTRYAPLRDALDQLIADLARSGKLG